MEDWHPSAELWQVLMESGQASVDDQPDAISVRY
jgi:hypothetical protein